MVLLIVYAAGTFFFGMVGYAMVKVCETAQIFLCTRTCIDVSLLLGIDIGLHRQLELRGR